MTDTNDPSWERKVLERLAFESLAEQKRRRRWGIFFKLLGLVYLTVLILQFVDWGDSAKKLADGKKHTALVELSGVIASNTEASAENIIEALQNAFKESTTQGVILRINSPGGSPVQSGMINDEIRRLRAKYKSIPLYVVVEDMCASGGYYVAAAADKIYVDKASLVGSIGVLMDGFGFTGTMDKLGVERRLLTAGENKGFLDPFSPQEPVQRDTRQAATGGHPQAVHRRGAQRPRYAAQGDAGDLQWLDVDRSAGHRTRLGRRLRQRAIRGAGSGQG